MGVTHHITNDSLAWLRERFKDRLISRKCEIEWAAHLPDLNPHIFICGGISRIMCMRTILKQLVRVIDNFARRIQVCLQRRGCHLEHILERTYKFYANWLRWLKLCGKIIHRLKFKSTKFEEIWWTYVGLINILRGSFFLGHPVTRTRREPSFKQEEIKTNRTSSIWGIRNGHQHTEPRT
jgi:hypothetical protein